MRCNLPQLDLGTALSGGSGSPRAGTGAVARNQPLQGVEMAEFPSSTFRERSVTVGCVLIGNVEPWQRRVAPGRVGCLVLGVLPAGDGARRISGCCREESQRWLRRQRWFPAALESCCCCWRGQWQQRSAPGRAALPLCACSCCTRLVDLEPLQTLALSQEGSF